jgi:hypothetical protein
MTNPPDTHPRLWASVSAAVSEMSTGLDANHAPEGQIRRAVYPAGSRERSRVACESGLSVSVLERYPSLSGTRQVLMHNARSAEPMLWWMSKRSPLGALVSTWSTAPPLVTK